MRRVMRALANASVTRASGNAFVTMRSTASARARARVAMKSSVGARREGARARGTVDDGAAGCRRDGEGGGEGGGAGADGGGERVSGMRGGIAERG